MKILQIVAPFQTTYAAFAIQNKKKAWVVERVPVMFFGLIPVTSGPGGEAIKDERTIEPLVYNFQGAGASIATSHKNFLGIEVMATANQVIKDWSKDLEAYKAINDPQTLPEAK